QTPQEGLSTRGVSSPIESRWLRLLRLSLVLCVASPLGGRYIFSFRAIVSKYFYFYIKMHTYLGDF
ncbi:hypothetical protein LT068_18355, partial [Vibrio cholerae]|nr:hypothetical protein [Vibrio cholerae]